MKRYFPIRTINTIEIQIIIRLFLFFIKNEADLKLKKRFSDQFKYEFQCRAYNGLPDIWIRIKKLSTLKNHRKLFSINTNKFIYIPYYIK